MNAVSIAFNIDPDDLAGATDSRLHALWCIAQANPAPFGDEAACGLASAIGDEIIRRWLSTSPVERFNHQPGHHAWKTLQQHGSWTGPGRTWLPHAASTTTSNTEGA